MPIIFSPLQCTRLVRSRLLDTECRSTASGAGEVAVEFAHDVTLVQQDREKGASFDFYVDTKICLTGKLGNNEVLKIAFTIRADYEIISKDVSIDDIGKHRADFGQQLFLSARTHTAYLLEMMGYNPGFLPFSISSGTVEQPTEEKNLNQKAAGKAKRGTESKRK